MFGVVENRSSIEHMDASTNEMAFNNVPSLRPNTSPTSIKFGINSFDIWALGITISIGGQYFLWNFGLVTGVGTYGIAILFLVIGYIILICNTSEITSALPFTGVSYGLARFALGNYWGFLIGCSEIVEYIFYVAASMIALESMFELLLPNVQHYPPVTYLIVYMVCVLIHIFGGRYFWMLNRILAILSVSILLLFVFGSMKYTDFNQYAPWTNSAALASSPLVPDLPIVSTYMPSLTPTYTFTIQPSTSFPSVVPSVKPTFIPSISFQPSVSPTFIPSVTPTTATPSYKPSITPTFLPSVSFTPSTTPSFIPSSSPTITKSPSQKPSFIPSRVPTFTPTIIPTLIPSVVPTFLPSFVPTIKLTVAPSFAPTIKPTVAPSFVPTFLPSFAPTLTPAIPSVVPTFLSLFIPTLTPTVIPTLKPSVTPFITPVVLPTLTSLSPSFTPTCTSTKSPTVLPTTRYPTFRPTVIPTATPTTRKPSTTPSYRPSSNPVTASPSVQPTTRKPSAVPSYSPSVKPTTYKPSTYKPSIEQVGFGGLSEKFNINDNTNDSQNSNPWFVGGAAMFMKVLPLAAWLFIGVESLKETCNDLDLPKIQVPRGQVSCVLTLACTAILVFFVCVSLPPGIVDMSTNIVPFNAGFQLMFDLTDAQTLQYATILSIPAIFATAFGFIMMYGKIIMAMSNSKFIPEFLGTQSSKTGSPYVALIIGSLLSYIVCVVSYWCREFRLNILNICILAAFCSYTLQCICYIILKTKYRTIKCSFHSPFGIYGAYISMFIWILGIIAVIGFQDDQYALIVICIIFSFCSIWYFVYARNHLFYTEDEKQILVEIYNHNHEAKFSNKNDNAYAEGMEESKDEKNSATIPTKTAVVYEKGNFDLFYNIFNSPTESKQKNKSVSKKESKGIHPCQNIDIVPSENSATHQQQQHRSKQSDPTKTEKKYLAPPALIGITTVPSSKETLSKKKNTTVVVPPLKKKITTVAVPSLKKKSKSFEDFDNCSNENDRNWTLVNIPTFSVSTSASATNTTPKTCTSNTSPNHKEFFGSPKVSPRQISPRMTTEDKVMMSPIDDNIPVISLTKKSKKKLLHFIFSQ